MPVLWILSHHSGNELLVFDVKFLGEAFNSYSAATHVRRSNNDVV